MEVQDRKIKSPIGPIFLFIYVIFSLVNRLLISKNVAFTATWIMIVWGVELAAIVAFAIAILIKKSGIPAIIPLSICAITSVINTITYPAGISGVFHILASTSILIVYLLLILLCLEYVGVSIFINYKGIIKVLVVISAPLWGLFKLLGTMPTAFHGDIAYYIISILCNIILCVSLIIVCFWIANPYGRKMTTAYRHSNGNEYQFNLALHIALTFLTFGIWPLMWIYRTTAYTNLAKDEFERQPFVCLLLSIFVPFYLIYWIYQSASRIDKIANERDVASDISIICLVFAFFIPHITFILMQEKINRTITEGTVSRDDPIKTAD